MKKVKIGIIGTGNMGAIGHIKCMLYTGKAEIIAIADTNAKSRKQAQDFVKYPIKKFERYKDLLAVKEIEAVVIATPNFTHKEIAIASLKAGKHVLCEKPMGITVKECREMTKCANKEGRILQIGLELRHTPLFKKVIELVSKGEKGKVKMIKFNESRNPFLKKVDEWIIDPKRSGDTLVEKCCHFFDLFNWIAGSKPVRVGAIGDSGGIYEDTGALSNAWSIVEYANGVKACLGLCMFTTHDDDGLRIIGDGGQMRCSHDTIIVEKGRIPRNKRYWNADIFHKKQYTVKVPANIRKLSHNGSLYYEDLAFIRTVAKGKKPSVDGTVGMWSIAVPYAAQKSIKEKRFIKISQDL